MKARIKETGEIVGLAQEIRGHKGESFQWFQIELIPEPYDEFFDWQSFRNQAAKDILCSIIQGGYAESRIKYQSEVAIKYTDELIKQLKEKEEQE